MVMRTVDSSEGAARRGGGRGSLMCDLGEWDKEGNPVPLDLHNCRHHIHVVQATLADSASATCEKDLHRKHAAGGPPTEAVAGPEG